MLNAFVTQTLRQTAAIWATISSSHFQCIFHKFYSWFSTAFEWFCFWAKIVFEFKSILLLTTFNLLLEIHWVWFIFTQTKVKTSLIQFLFLFFVYEWNSSLMNKVNNWVQSVPFNWVFSANEYLLLVRCTFSAPVTIIC